MKLCVIGGTGARSAFLTKSLVKNARSIRVDHIVLLDNDPRKLRTYGSIAKEIAARLDPELKFTVTSDPVAALTDVDYIITTIRAGGDEGRLFDERTCMELGVLGQETTGGGGFAMAIRSIPTLIYYCNLAKKLAKPGHLIFNFTNPSGIITQAMRQQGFDNVYGICDAPSGFIKQLEEILEVPDGALDVECYGLNHLSWFRNARLQGKDIQKELLADPRVYKYSEMRLFTKEMAQLNDGCMLNEYLYFYYCREKSLSMIRKAEHPRGEMIYLINRELEEQLDKLEFPRDFEKGFALYMQAYGKRENAYFSVESGANREKVWVPPTVEEFLSQPDEGGYAAVALRFIHAITDGTPCRMILSVPNQGAIDGLADDDVVEITCDITREGAKPVKIGKISSFQLLQIQRIKFFERSTIRAILENDREAAVQGLYMHPLVNDLQIAEKLVDTFFTRYERFIHMSNS